MLNAFRLTGRAGGVKKEQRVLGFDPLRLTIGRGVADEVVPPDVALSIHRHGLVGTPTYDDPLDARTAVGQRLVGGSLQLDDVSAPPAPVGRNNDFRARVLNTLLQGKGGEAG